MTITTGISELVVALDAKHKERAKDAKEARELDERHKLEIERVEHDIELMDTKSLSLEDIELAKSVISLGGKIEESAEGAFERALVMVAAGGAGLLDEYVGAKRYGRFHQGVRCRYGYGPSHGTIVFSVGLAQAVRDDRTRRGDGPILTPEERDAAVRWLMAEKRATARRSRW